MGFGVKQHVVFAAFRAKNISYAAVPDSKHLYEVAASNGEMNTEYIPPELGRRAPQRFSDVYGIPLAWFYNELLIPGQEEDKPPN